MKKLNAILIVFMLGGLSACASMSKDECLNANWKTIGYEDGSLGRPETTIQAHRKACAKINITPDLTQYQQGHREGVRVYCKKSTGYQLGVNGGAYLNLCPADLEPAFLQAYRLGQELFAVRQKMNQVEDEINGYKTSIDNLQQQKAEQEKLIVNAGSSAKERRAYLNEINRLQDEIHRYEHDLSSAEYDLDHLAEDYAGIEAAHRRKGY
jgi:prefoldin subunit 5